MDCSPQAPLSMELPRQEYWSGLPFPLPGDLPDPEVEPRSPALQVDSLPSEPQGKPWVLACFPEILFCVRICVTIMVKTQKNPIPRILCATPS